MNNPYQEEHVAFHHLVFNLFGIKTRDNDLVKFFVYHRFHENVLSISEIPEADYDELEYVDQGHTKELTNASLSHLRVWSAYCTELAALRTLLTVTSLPQITPQEFNEFRRFDFPVKYKGPIPPGPDSKYYPRLQTSLADGFKKGIKHDPSLFPIFKNDTSFDSWRRDTEAQS